MKCHKKGREERQIGFSIFYLKIEAKYLRELWENEEKSKKEIRNHIGQVQPLMLNDTTNGKPGRNTGEA